MKRDHFDWMMVGFVVLFLVVFVAFVHARGGTITGKLIGVNSLAPACESFSDLESVSVSSTLNLCRGQTHLVDYFSVESPNVIIQCNQSILQGNGGALFVSKIPNAHITLRGCIVQGYDGFYQSANPLSVRME